MAREHILNREIVSDLGLSALPAGEPEAIEAPREYRAAVIAAAVTGRTDPRGTGVSEEGAA